MALSDTVYKINGNFSRKSQNFPPLRVFSAPAEGVPLGIGRPTSDRDKKKLEWRGYMATRLRKKFDDILSCLDTIGLHERDI